MAEILKLPQFIDQNRMPKMKIRCRRIKPGLYPKRAAFSEFLDEFRFNEELVATSLCNFQLFFDFHFVCCPPSAHRPRYGERPAGMLVASTRVI